MQVNGTYTKPAFAPQAKSAQLKAPPPPPKDPPPPREDPPPPPREEGKGELVDFKA